MSLFTVTDYDRQFYAEHLRDFLPEKMIDIHTHIWRNCDRKKEEYDETRTVKWPGLVAPQNPIEDLNETYRLMFPDKQVTPMIFNSPRKVDSFTVNNAYTADAAARFNYPALAYTRPTYTAEQVEKLVLGGKFLGVKSYLSLSSDYIPEKEVRIFDFFPHHQLEVCDQHGWIVMLHIPRDGRLKDPVNLQQILEIKRRYKKLKLIIAHVGRAYCQGDVGNAFEVLAEADDLLFDFCANSNQYVFEQLLKSVSTDRIMFGSDMPILRMRTRRIEENGTYINLIPPGMYGDPSQDRHLREVSPEEAEKITFFMYEEIYAMRRAMEACGLATKENVEKLFYSNAKKLIDTVRTATYGG